MPQVAEIIDLIKQGYTTAEIKKQGYSHALVSHASSAYTYAQRDPLPPNLAEDVPAVQTKAPRRRGKLKSSAPSDGLSKPGTLFVGSRDTQAEALLLQSKAMRLPMPELLPMAMSAARREWNWDDDMSVTDFIDTVIWHFFASKGIFLGTYYKLEDMERLITDAGGSSPPVISSDLALPPLPEAVYEPEPEEAPEPEEIQNNWVLQDQSQVVIDDVDFSDVIEKEYKFNDIVGSNPADEHTDIGITDVSPIVEVLPADDEINADTDSDVVTIKDILMAKGGS